MSREYTKGNVTVVWDHTKCIHSAKCVNGLPNVFKPKESPWIQMDSEDENKVAEQVSKCPSGALSLK